MPSDKLIDATLAEDPEHIYDISVFAGYALEKWH
jgi:hypothetical protein